MFAHLLEKAKVHSASGEALVVSILYIILKDILERDELIITALEHELLCLEETPFKELPHDFLETTFHLRKEVNQLVPSLHHLREILTVVASKRVPLQGFDEPRGPAFESLMDKAVYLHETAQNARENLVSLIDLYINTTSYEMNKVMRLIAVITCLAIVPTLVGGLMGMNLIGNPWRMHLWQVVVFVAVVMFSMGWIFHRLGWLKK
jgi:Mg2+ and Co2+ transporter CorA